MMRWLACLLAAWPGVAWAGFTDTAPVGVAVIESSWMAASLNHAWDGQGKLGSLIPPIVRYEPGGGMQGTLIPGAAVRYDLMVTQLQVGVRPDLTLVLAVPVALRTQVTPDLQWIPGDYQPQLGRPYSADDFWQWAASMGQPKPGPWTGNQGVPGDVVLVARWRFSDHLPALRERRLRLAVQAIATVPTGRAPDPEEVVSAGTSNWDLHAQGEFGLHLSADQGFAGAWSRLTLSADAFYEAFVPRTYPTPRGTRHPLLLSFASYVGDTHRLDPGDFAGGSLQAEFVAWEGPQLDTWLARRVRTALPPTLRLSLRYTYVHLQPSVWQSQSPLWDAERVQGWDEGYKSIASGQAIVSLLRWGVPAEILAGFRNLEWLGGRNTRAANVLSIGVRVPVPLW